MEARDREREDGAAMVLDSQFNVIKKSRKSE